jgi:hypothetical protein
VRDTLNSMIIGISTVFVDGILMYSIKDSGPKALAKSWAFLYFDLVTLALPSHALASMTLLT